MPKTKSTLKQTLPLMKIIRMFLVFLVAIVVSVFLGGEIAHLITMASLNIVFSSTGDGHILQEPSARNMIHLEGEALEVEYSSYIPFTIIDKTGSHQADEFPVSADLRNPVTGHTVHYLIKRAPVEPGDYQLQAQNYDLETNPIDVEVWGKGIISATMSRSSYDVDFGLGSDRSYTNLGAIIGGIIAFLIVFFSYNPK